MRTASGLVEAALSPNARRRSASRARFGPRARPPRRGRIAGAVALVPLSDESGGGVTGFSGLWAPRHRHRHRDHLLLLMTRIGQLRGAVAAGSRTSARAGPARADPCAATSGPPQCSPRTGRSRTGASCSATPPQSRRCSTACSLTADLRPRPRFREGSPEHWPAKAATRRRDIAADLDNLTITASSYARTPSTGPAVGRLAARRRVRSGRGRWGVRGAPAVWCGTAPVAIAFVDGTLPTSSNARWSAVACAGRLRPPSGRRRSRRFPRTRPWSPPGNGGPFEHDKPHRRRTRRGAALESAPGRLPRCPNSRTRRDSRRPRRRNAPPQPQPEQAKESLPARRCSFEPSGKHQAPPEPSRGNRGSGS